MGGFDPQLKSSDLLLNQVLAGGGLHYRNLGHRVFDDAG